MQLQTLFGNNVRHYRRAAGWNMEELADAVGVSRETIGKIERGTAAPLFETAEKIALALELHPATLFTGQAEPAGERGQLLRRIYSSLSDLNEDDLTRLANIIEAFSAKR